VTRGAGFFRPYMAFSARRPTSRVDGDATARFRQTMLPHMDAAYNFARYLARDPVAAEDIVQEAFLSAFRSFGGWRGEGAKAWLLAIVKHVFLDWVRAHREGTQTSESEDLTPDPDTPESLLLQANETAMLRQTIAGLPEPFRETLVLRELEDLSYKENAVITAVPIGTVMSRLARAREMLSVLLLPDAEIQRKAQS